MLAKKTGQNGQKIIGLLHGHGRLSTAKHPFLILFSILKILQLLQLFPGNAKTQKLSTAR